VILVVVAVIIKINIEKVMAVKEAKAKIVTIALTGKILLK
jgi:hypothetical protein